MNKKIVAIILSLGILLGGAGIASINTNKREVKRLVTSNNKNSVSKKENSINIEDSNDDINNSKEEINESSSNKISEEKEGTPLVTKEASNNHKIVKSKDTKEVKSTKEDFYNQDGHKSCDA